jgi:hypothetical protein
VGEKDYAETGAENAKLYFQTAHRNIKHHANNDDGDDNDVADARFAGTLIGKPLSRVGLTASLVDLKRNPLPGI